MDPRAREVPSPGSASGSESSSASGSASGSASRAPVVVAGGGVAGQALALALATAPGVSLEVVLCDPALARAAPDEGRAYAIAAAARRMLTRLGVWDGLAAAAQPIRDMVVSDSRLDDPVRPVFLTFAGEVEPGEPFAHMVEGGALARALAQACRAAGVALRPVGVAAAELGESPDARLIVVLADGDRLPAALLVAADGARSRLREAAGIGFVGWSYPQAALVATVHHERDHEGRAVEHFLPAGPFAILPLAPRGAGAPPGASAAEGFAHRSSIVWTEARAEVPRLLALPPGDLLAELERRFGLALGALALEDRPRSYPLSLGVARRFVGPRLALLGDAAHVIHPIAGQGLNLGFKDTAALAEAVVEAARLGLDPGGPEALRAYERARRFDTVALAAVTDGLNRLFSNDRLPLRLARDLGLGLVDRLPGLKRLFIREAAGAAEGPRLLRGEAL